MLTERVVNEGKELASMGIVVAATSVSAPMLATALQRIPPSFSLVVASLATWVGLGIIARYPARVRSWVVVVGWASAGVILFRYAIVVVQFIPLVFTLYVCIGVGDTSYRLGRNVLRLRERSAP